MVWKSFSFCGIKNNCNLFLFLTFEYHQHFLSARRYTYMQTLSIYFVYQHMYTYIHPTSFTHSPNGIKQTRRNHSGSNGTNRIRRNQTSIYSTIYCTLYCTIYWSIASPRDRLHRTWFRLCFIDNIDSSRFVWYFTLFLHTYGYF